MTIFSKTWDTLKNIGNFFLTEIGKEVSKNREIQYEYESMGDDELLQILVKSRKDHKTKGIIAKILRSRGYDEAALKKRWIEIKNK